MSSILEYLLSFPRYSSFCSKFMTSQTVHMTVINHKIENISENIGWVLFKLGTNNVHQIIHVQCHVGTK